MDRREKAKEFRTEKVRAHSSKNMGRESRFQKLVSSVSPKEQIITDSSFRNKYVSGKGAITDKQCNEAESVNEVLRYWFMLDREMVKAIQKGRHELLDVAKARTIFLKKVVNEKDLKAGLEGDEEAICKIQDFLFNNGWWERANNLNIKDMRFRNDSEEEKRMLKEEQDIISFILHMKHLVHPNVLDMALRKDKEGIRMALNHIHYGSLQQAREANQILSSTNINSKNIGEFPSRPLQNNLVRNFKKFQIKKQAVFRGPEHQRVELDLLKSQGHLVDGWILREALKGEEFYVNRALYQIHSRSLENGVENCSL